MTAVLERDGDNSRDWERDDAMENNELVVDNEVAAANNDLRGDNAAICAPGSEIAEANNLGVDITGDGEAGLATAEYAIATIAAVGFGALLMAVLSSSSVQKLLENIFKAALTRAL